MLHFAACSATQTTNTHKYASNKIKQPNKFTNKIYHTNTINCSQQIQQVHKIVHTKYNKFMDQHTTIQHSFETIQHIVFKQIQQICNYCCPFQFHHSSMRSF
jgi:hypothetical protein